MKRNGRERKRWRGRMAGFRRGSDIDRELTQVANARVGKMKSLRSLHRLTRLAIAAIHADGMRIVSAQQPVSSMHRRVATAVDLLCIRPLDHDRGQFELILVEVKTGYENHRMNSQSASPQHMNMPLQMVEDSWCHRHMAQIATTWRLFIDHTELVDELNQQLNVTEISGMVLYLTEKDVEAIPLPEWWGRMSEEILNVL